MGRVEEVIREIEIVKMVPVYGAAEACEKISVAFMPGQFEYDPKKDDADLRVGMEEPVSSIHE